IGGLGGGGAHALGLARQAMEDVAQLFHGPAAIEETLLGAATFDLRRVARLVDAPRRFEHQRFGRDLDLARRARALGPELEAARRPGEDLVGRVLALALLVVDGVDDASVFEDEERAALALMDDEPARGAVQEQQLSQVEEADEPELARERGQSGRAHAASRKGGCPRSGPPKASRPSRLITCMEASAKSMTPS